MLRYLFVLCLTLGLFVWVGFFSNAQEHCVLDGECAMFQYCSEGACHPCTDNNGNPAEPDADGDGHNRILCGGDDCDDSLSYR